MKFKKELFVFKVSYFTKGIRKRHKVMAVDFENAIKEAYKKFGKKIDITSLVKSSGKSVKLY